MKNKIFTCIVSMALGLFLNVTLATESFASCSINSCSTSCPVAKRTVPKVKPCFTGKAAPVGEVKKTTKAKKHHYKKSDKKVVYKVVYRTKTVYKTKVVYKTAPCPCSNCGDNCPCKSRFPYHERKMTGGCPKNGCPCATTPQSSTPCPCQQEATPCPCQTK